MKNFSLALLVVVVVIAPVASTDEHRSPQPTALESFVARPTVVLDLAEVVGTSRVRTRLSRSPRSLRPTPRNRASV